MLITSIVQFIGYIPTAEGTQFNAIEPYLSEAENQLIGLFLGEDLYQYFETLQAENPLKVIASRLLCLQAYENAIPFVDLIQTNNGFAVVNNSNQLPASKERVQRLIEWCSVQLYMNTDLLIQGILKDAEALAAWTAFSEFEDLTNCLILTGNDFAKYATVSGVKRKSFMDAKSNLVSWQKNILEKVISADYMQQLIAETRLNTFTEASKVIIIHCKMVLGQLVNKNTDEAEKICNILSNILDKDLETYTVYANSAEYALKTTPVYQNLQSDPTYFFG